MKNFALFFSLILSQFVFSQTEDALIFFADKENVQQSIDNPITILTQASLDRKALHNIPIDERDVPVNENYITQVKAQPGITVLAKSKWMNAVYVRGNLSNIDDLIDLPFVIDIEYANKTLNFGPGNQNPVDKFFVKTTKTDFNYGFAANQIEMLNGDYLHQEDYTGEGMIIAFMDSGFPGVTTIGGFARMRDNGNLLGTYDFVERTEAITTSHSHGTRTLSTAAGYIENQFVGTAPDASYYIFRTEDADSETPVEEAYWLEAVERADSLGVHVINTSLGYREYDNPDHSHTYQDLDGQTTISARGANIGYEKGMLLINSAGNGGNSGFPWVTTPGDAIGMLTIGAVDEDGNYASFSSIGPTADGRIKPDVMTQGRDAYNINASNEIGTGNGTSFSSPILAGLAACLWQAKMERTNENIMQIIRESAHLYNNPTNQMGYGIPNFETALTAVLASESFQEDLFSVYPNPAKDILNIDVPKSFTQAEIVIYNVLGNKISTYIINSENTSFDISSLKQGVYFLSINANNLSQTIKFIKK